MFRDGLPRGSSSHRSDNRRIRQVDYGNNVLLCRGKLLYVLRDLSLILAELRSFVAIEIYAFAVLAKSIRISWVSTTSWMSSIVGTCPAGYFFDKRRHHLLRDLFRILRRPLLYCRHGAGDRARYPVLIERHDSTIPLSHFREVVIFCHGISIVIVKYESA